jgi:glycerol-3-phosphate dehydrogenase
MESWERLAASPADPFDVLVIGGGITGAGVALDAASRGLRVALVERFDFASGTSSKSSKLVHGGLRYLEQRDFGLVREASVERGLLNRLAPHLVESIPFVIPIADRWRRAKFGVGMWAYDALAGFRNTSTHRYVDAETVSHLVPAFKAGTTETGGRLRGGYVYYDSRTDDVRLVMEVLVQAVRLGTTVANYAAARALDCSGAGCRALVEDTIDGTLTQVAARRVVVAGGVWNDRIEALTNPGVPPRLRPSKGVHLVFRREDVPLDGAAAFIPDAQRRRMLFLIPWHDVVIAGTTDTDHFGALDHPQVTAGERTYFLDALNAALGLSLGESDVVSAWAGLRPLVRAEGSTVDLSRSHAVYEFAPGVVGITGGKLTTYRRMAQDAVDRIAPDLGNAKRPRARWIKLGCGDLAALTGTVQRRADRLGISIESAQHLIRCYGDRALAVLEIGAATGLTDALVEGHAPIQAEALYCAHSEMTVQLSDLLARRVRLSLTSATAGLDDTPVELLAGELSWNSDETARQVLAYRNEVELERGTALLRGVPA